MIIGSQFTFGQFGDCSIDPTKYTDLTVSGAFNGNYVQRQDIAVFEGGPGLAFLLKVRKGTGFQTVWSSTALDANKLRGRVVTLDADGDGFKNEIAGIYQTSSTSISILVWKYNSISNNWSYYNSWSSPIGSGYDATKITNRVVAGDFDRDGKEDDIAAFYDYGGGSTKIHVFQFSGITSVTYTWMYETTGYDCTKITGRLVSGDFDRDGAYDNIAALYDYTNVGQGVKMHVFKSNGTNLSQLNYFWQVANGYDPSKVTGTLVSGNFDDSRYGNWISSGGPHNDDDIVAFYDYGNGNVKTHTWINNGSQGFSYQWKWESSGFDVNQIRGRVVPLQASTDMGMCTYNVGALYNYGVSTTNYYRWDNNFSKTWNFNPSINLICGGKNLLNNDIALNNEIEEEKQIDFSIYPNPTNGIIRLANKIDNSDEIEIYNSLGEKINFEFTDNSKTEIDLSNLHKGVYTILFRSQQQNKKEKLIIN